MQVFIVHKIFIFIFLIKYYVYLSNLLLLYIFFVKDFNIVYLFFISNQSNEWVNHYGLNIMNLRLIFLRFETLDSRRTTGCLPESTWKPKSTDKEILHYHFHVCTPPFAQSPLCVCCVLKRSLIFFLNRRVRTC